ncbi:hypothetical protein AAX29_01842 [Aliarcobacter thereius]|uniref:Uncharacterized protein n=1 Tax=Aliarcobacter thereius TaxID=544718 RepID=A0A1C0B568_9BACT|nr:hypothetical protein [Aliarcobacter thereius]OCL97689.1 hypothetical protein AAX29_01842 [Aliarcobacter thereius]
MRLTEINYKIEELDLSNSSIKLTDSNTLSNLINFKNLIEEIEKYELNFYNTEINKLKNSFIYLTTQDIIKEYTYEKLIYVYNISKYIVDSLNSLKLVLSNILPSPSENELSIKLPTTNNLEDLLKDMSKIEKQLSIIVNDKEVDTYITLSKWEYGSYWIDIAIGTSFAISLIGSISWSAAYISSLIKKNKEHTLYLQKIETDAQMLSAIKEKQLLYLDKLYETEVLNIQENYFDNKENNERNKKIKDTIKLFADIIQRGGEFQPSLISPKEIKDSYPDFKNIEHIPSKVLQIPEKTENQEEQE